MIEVVIVFIALGFCAGMFVGGLSVLPIREKLWSFKKKLYFRKHKVDIFGEVSCDTKSVLKHMEIIDYFGIPAFVVTDVDEFNVFLNSYLFDNFGDCSYSYFDYEHDTEKRRRKYERIKNEISRYKRE